MAEARISKRLTVGTPDAPALLEDRDGHAVGRERAGASQSGHPGADHGYPRETLPHGLCSLPRYDLFDILGKIVGNALGSRLHAVLALCPIGRANIATCFVKA